jgi:microcystin-dependent protein
VSTGPTSGDSGGTSFHVTPGEGQSVALTEQEQVLVSKLLGDPTYFPIEFRRWLKDFMDNANIQISKGQIMGGGAGGGSDNPSLLPAGIVLPLAGSVIPKDCVLCNGTEYDRTDFADLFAAIGVAWGTPSVNTKFKVPDLRDRALYGVGSVVSLAQVDGKSTGNRGGPYHHHDVSGNTSQAGAHNHSVSLGDGPNHQHSYSAIMTGIQIQQGTQGGFVGVGDNTNSGGVTSSGGAHNHSVSVGQAPNHQHSFSGSTTGGYDDKPSFAGVNYVITTGKASAT